MAKDDLTIREDESVPLSKVSSLKAAIVAKDANVHVDQVDISFDSPKSLKLVRGSSIRSAKIAIS
jgi:hypothetical protein